ncbi:magnesium transporter CorA family protein [Myxococcota bacterium]|nr:magnesium transporter CorA family protein [Myxococcota bacterium]
MVRIRVHTPRGIVAAPAEDLSRWLSDPEAWTWVDLVGRTELAERILTDVFGFHPVVVRDCLEDVRHPRVHAFDNWLYLVVHGVKAMHQDEDGVPLPPPEGASGAEPDDPGEGSEDRAGGEAGGEGDSGEYRTVELDAFLGPRFLVTYHHERMDAIDEAYRRTVLPESPGMGEGEVAFLRELLDTLVDQYDPVLDRFDTELSALEFLILDRPSPEHLADLLRLKRGLQRMRRINGHQQATILRLARGEFPLIPERERPFFRDVTDRLARISDLTETYRETASALLETYVSVASNRLSEVMRTLTVATLLLMPPTLIAGIYGMNFRHMPELGWVSGYPMAMALMVASAAAVLFWLNRRGMLR